MKHFQLGCYGTKSVVACHLKKVLKDNSQLKASEPELRANKPDETFGWLSFRVDVDSEKDISVEDLRVLFDKDSPVEFWSIDVACCSFK